MRASVCSTESCSRDAISARSSALILAWRSANWSRTMRSHQGPSSSTIATSNSATPVSGHATFAVMCSEKSTAAPLISNRTFLSAAAGMLAVEAYHAATIRTELFDRDLARQANAISDARDSLDGPGDDDQGITLNGMANIVPADGNSVAFGRTPGRVLNVVYLTPNRATSGGFYPNGVNGQVRTSG